MNATVKNSSIIGSAFERRIVDISTATDISDTTRFSVLKLTKTIGLIFYVTKTLINFRPTLTYITLSPVGMAFYKDGFLAIISRLFSTKIVFHLHGKGVSNITKTRGWRRWIYQFVFRGVYVIHLSNHLTKDVKGLVSHRHIYVVNNGLDLPKGELYTRRDVSIVRFLYLSNLVSSKGAMELLDACISLESMGDSFEVSFVGRFFEQHFEEKFKKKLSSTSGLNIRLLDEGAYGEDKLIELKRHHVLILPTYYPNECFPLVLIEAMASKMAIISTNEGAISDMVEDGINGYIVEKKSASSIAKAMESLIFNPNKAYEMGVHGYEKYKNCYSSSVFENNLLSVLTDIIRA